MSVHKNEFVEGLTEARAKELLTRMIARLDDADAEDQLGSEGWRENFGMRKDIP